MCEFAALLLVACVTFASVEASVHEGGFLSAANGDASPRNAANSIHRVDGYFISVEECHGSNMEWCMHCRPGYYFSKMVNGSFIYCALLDGVSFTNDATVVGEQVEVSCPDNYLMSGVRSDYERMRCGGLSNGNSVSGCRKVQMVEDANRSKSMMCKLHEEFMAGVNPKGSEITCCSVHRN